MYFIDSRPIACEKLSDPKNGSVKQRGVLYDAKAIYSCDEGYILTGTKVRVCQRNGKFSDDAPTCERESPILQCLYNLLQLAVSMMH